jgi:hypothetical protein
MRNSAWWLVGALIAAGACSPSDESALPNGSVTARDTTRVLLQAASNLADSLAAICPDSARRGSVQVARPDSNEAETGIAFALMGDGAGPGAILCRDVIYARADTLLSVMGEPGSVSERNGFAVIDSMTTRIPAYRHDGVTYVAVRPFARHRRAVYLDGGQPMDAIVWPRAALLHLKAAGLTQGRAYQTAVREGLLP